MIYKEDIWDNHMSRCLDTLNKKKGLPVRTNPFVFRGFLYQIMPPQLQPEQQRDVRWAHGRESKIHS